MNCLKYGFLQKNWCIKSIRNWMKSDFKFFLFEKARNAVTEYICVLILCSREFMPQKPKMMIHLQIILRKNLFIFVKKIHFIKISIKYNNFTILNLEQENYRSCKFHFI